MFNSVYLLTDGDVVENPANTLRDVDLLVRAAGLHPAARVLDLCCRHTLELARRGFHAVVGADQSRYLLGLAKKRARAERLVATFREADARQLPFASASFDCVAVLGNSFGYFANEEDDLAMLRETRRVLAPGGTLAMDLTDGAWTRSHFEPRSWEWVDENRFVCRERGLSKDSRRLVCREILTDTDKGVLVDQFYAETLFRREDIRDLLERSNFETVSFHEPPATESDRNQDLGMFDHRMFLAALASASPQCRSSG